MLTGVGRDEALDAWDGVSRRTAERVVDHIARAVVLLLVLILGGVLVIGTAAGMERLVSERVL